uniref:Cytochrome c oxidase assembly factor 7 homolog n=1 Tax=Photinus pyralis TaxID=7054 RepID=A0A1Y1KJP4_PHOPY
MLQREKVRRYRHTEITPIDSLSQYELLSVCHLLGDYLEAIDKDYKKASKVYKTNCDEYKYPRSCYKYATYSLLGKGCKQNYHDAYRYFEQGCNLDHPESCLHQGLLKVTKHDSSDIPIDILKGMQLLEKACAAKNANACYYLSGMYISGVRKPDVKVKHHEKVGDDAYEVKKNMEEAFKYAEHGCNLGHIYSCSNLSQMYSKGDGVVKDVALAEKYRKIALEMQAEIQSTKTLEFGQGIKN